MMKSLTAALLITCTLAQPDAPDSSLQGGWFTKSSKFGSPEECCYSLRCLGEEKVLLRNSSDYRVSIDSYWSDQAKLSPYCIFQPKSTTDVSRAVQTLVEFSCQFAIRGGGHTPWAGSNNIDNGVTIDFSQMRGVQYDTKSKLAKIQPGSRWGDVYPALEPFKVTVAGGRAADVGVAGLITGGGNSFFSAREGFACDNVANFEVVLADGTVVNANKRSNADLFQVLKGGSNNFGIVTRFDLYAIEESDFWGGIGTWPESATSEHIQAFVNFGNNLEKDRKASLISIWNYNSFLGRTALINIFHYTKPQDNPTPFKELRAIEGLQTNSFRIASHSNFTGELGQASDRRKLWYTTSFQNDVKVFEKTYEIFKEKAAYAKKQAVGNFTIAPLYQPIPGFFTELSEEKGGNVLGLDKSQNIIWFLWNLSWDDKRDDHVFQAIGSSTIKEIDTFAANSGRSSRYKYLNYAHISQNPLRSYGNENVEKIRAAAKKYDPRQVFQYLVPGGFKVSNV